MDILAGEATIDQLYEKGYIRHLSDLYSLTKEQLVSLDGWKDRSAENLLASLEKSKSVPFNRVFYALGIRHVGEANAKLLTAHFGSIDAIMAADRDALVQIDEVGDIMADSIIRWFADPVNREQVEKLRAEIRAGKDEKSIKYAFRWYLCSFRSFLRLEGRNQAVHREPRRKDDFIGERAYKLPGDRRSARSGKIEESREARH